ncbi:hypothetical protein SNE35_31440 [Paucibacter sp. R3-3]|uniref:Uncharacterized protein n=1 Tax=Roseateles agri TaxID=3098619 RepID=A0ABU5DRV9_9BURK|nr:hypothetical protein [Paucibacter sp. R3-3]MDY0749053.1 hypothetical protein [Paucibacter sp. R3-3]
MSLHMLLQFPLLLAAGWAASLWLPGERTQALVDEMGLTGAAWVGAVTIFWMLPIALDLALLDPLMAALKYSSWWSAGLALARSWPRLTVELRAFFLGNTAWMLATAGLLYRETEVRLCVSYRYDEQSWTGAGLMFWAVALGTVALTARRASPREVLQQR